MFHLINLKHISGNNMAIFNNDKVNNKFVGIF